MRHIPFALALPVVLATAACSAPVETASRPTAQAATVEGPAREAALDLLKEDDQPVTMTIASTRSGVSAWEYRLTDHAFIVGGLTGDVFADGTHELQNEVAIALRADGDKLVIDSVAWKNETMLPREVVNFLEDARADYDAATASIPEV